MAFMFSGLVYEGKGDMSECSQYMKKAIGLSQYVYFLILPFFFSVKKYLLIFTNFSYQVQIIVKHLAFYPSVSPYLC